MAVVAIADAKHPVKVGASDAYYNDTSGVPGSSKSGRRGYGWQQVLSLTASSSTHRAAYKLCNVKTKSNLFLALRSSFWIGQ